MYLLTSQITCYIFWQFMAYDRIFFKTLITIWTRNLTKKHCPLPLLSSGVLFGVAVWEGLVGEPWGFLKKKTPKRGVEIYLLINI